MDLLERFKVKYTDQNLLKWAHKHASAQTINFIRFTEQIRQHSHTAACILLLTKH